jgi:dTDP-glucose 4,6-dehydratase
MRVVVAGGAGFIGSHLCDQLLARGDEVIAVDNLSTGSPDNIIHLETNENFNFVELDIVYDDLHFLNVDAVVNLASPASPPMYLAMPLETLAAGSEGTRHLLELSELHGARFIQASTSEVYGDPLVHPQPEDYWGNVNPVGPRSVYDESKRFSEALVMAHQRALDSDVGIARIFNTYGPRLLPHDGRVVSNFITQSLRGQDLTVYGDGDQTRSLCFVDDMARGLVALLDSSISGPVNLGNPAEITVLKLAETIINTTESLSQVIHLELPVDDPQRRRPDIALARELLAWEPVVELEKGLIATIKYFESRIDQHPLFG